MSEKSASEVPLPYADRPIGDGAARVVPVRMDDSLVAAVDQRAEKDGTSRSEIIRSAVRAFVA